MEIEDPKVESIVSETPVVPEEVVAPIEEVAPVAPTE